MTELKRLAAQLRVAKDVEADARNERLAIESDIVAHPDVARLLRDEGTHRIGDVTITTKLTRKWDPLHLDAMRAEVDHAFWPFRWKEVEDLKAMRVFEERFPDLARDIKKGLTLTPAKPAIKVADVDEKGAG